MSNRTIRVNELIQRELSAILRKFYQAEAVTITIAEVRVSPDLSAFLSAAIVTEDSITGTKLQSPGANVGTGALSNLL